MTSSIPAVLAFTATLLSSAVANDCDGHFTLNGIYQSSQDCSLLQFCCGSCDNRFCCSDYSRRLNDDICSDMEYYTISAAASIVTGIIFFIFIIACCFCPCCCLYKMCRKTRPVMATTTTTVVSTTQYPQQQPTNPATQYPGYQPVPAQPGYSVQPGYGGQAMPPYPAQPYAPGPPPPYQETGGYPAPYSQAAYDGAQAPYPLNPPVKPGYAQPPPPIDYNAAQPPYNPAYMEPPKTGY